MRRFVRTACVGLAWCLAVTAPAPGAAAQESAAGLAATVAELGAFDYEIRTRAARLIRRTPAAEAVPVLSGAVRAHGDEFVRFRALVLLTGFNDRGTAALMHELIADRNDRVREVVYRWFERHPDPAITRSLLAALQHESAEFVRPALIGALAALGDDETVQRALLFEVGRGMDFFRSAVIETLGRHRAAYATSVIGDAARNPGPLQHDAVVALGRIGGPAATPALERLSDLTPEAAVARPTALCLAARQCDTHFADAVRAASAPGAPRSVVRAAIEAMAAAAVDGDDARALSVLYDLAGTVRADAARGLGIAAIRDPDALLGWLDRIPDEARPDAFELVADGVSRLEDEYRKEQLFTALRAAYWAAPEQGPLRGIASALIEQLEF